MRGVWQVLRSHHVGLTKHIGEKSARRRVIRVQSSHFQSPPPRAVFLP